MSLIKLYAKIYRNTEALFFHWIFETCLINMKDQGHSISFKYHMLHMQCTHIQVKENADQIGGPWIPASPLNLPEVMWMTHYLTLESIWLISLSLFPYNHKYDSSFIISPMDMAILHAKFVWLSVATITTFFNRSWKLNSANWVVKTMTHTSWKLNSSWRAVSQNPRDFGVKHYFPRGI